MSSVISKKSPSPPSSELAYSAIINSLTTRDEINSHSTPLAILLKPKIEKELCFVDNNWAKVKIQDSATESLERKKITLNTLFSLAEIARDTDRNDDDNEYNSLLFDYQFFLYLTGLNLDYKIDWNSIDETKLEELDLESYLAHIKKSIERGHLNNFDKILNLIPDTFKSSTYKSNNSETFEFKELIIQALDKGVITSPIELKNISFYPWEEVIEKAIDKGVIRNCTDLISSINFEYIERRKYDLDYNPVAILIPCFSAGIFKNLIKSQEDYSHVLDCLNKNINDDKTRKDSESSRFFLDLMAYSKGLSNKNPFLNPNFNYLFRFTLCKPYWRYLIDSISKDLFSKEQVEQMLSALKLIDHKIYNLIFEMSVYKAGLKKDKPVLDKETLTRRYTCNLIEQHGKKTKKFIAETPNLFQIAFDMGVISNKEEFNKAFEEFNHLKKSIGDSIPLAQIPIIDEVIFEAYKKGYIDDFNSLIDDIVHFYKSDGFSDDDDETFKKSDLSHAFKFLAKAINYDVKLNEQELNAYINRLLQYVIDYRSNDFETIYAYHELLFALKDKNLVSEEFYDKHFENISRLQKFCPSISKLEDRSKLAELILKGLEAGFSSIDHEFYKSIIKEAQGLALPLNSVAKVHQLKQYPELNFSFEKKDYKEVTTLMNKIAQINAASRKKAQIDLKDFFEKNFQAYFNLKAISGNITKHILDTFLAQRQYLPMFEEIFQTSAFLKPTEIVVLRNFIQNNTQFFNTEPLLLLDFIGYLNAFKLFGLDIAANHNKSFKAILENNTGSKESLLYNLGLTLIQELCSERNLDIEIDFEKITADKFLEDWDLRYLGTLVASFKNQNFSKDIFKVLIKAKLEGTEDGIIWPPAYKNYPLEIYGNQESQEQVLYIRRMNLHLLREMERKGIDVNIWLNAHEDSVIKHHDCAVGDGDQREVIDIVNDFDEIFQKASPLIDSFLNRVARKTNIEAKEISRLQRKFSLIQPHFNGLKPGIAKFGYALVLKHLQGCSQDELSDFLNKVLNCANEEDVALPEEVYNLEDICNEVLEYNCKPKKVKAKNYRIHFANPKDIGRQLFIGNRAKSCTAVGQNTYAAVDFLVHLGTKYLVIENLSGDSENPHGTLQAYKRVFAGLDPQNKPIIAVDSTNGSIAHRLNNAMNHQLKLLTLKAKKVKNGRERKPIPLNLQPKKNRVNSIIGGMPQRLSGNYFNYYELEEWGKQMELPTNPKELEALDNWQPIDGWKEFKSC